jgi:hypothetical protein
MTFKNHQVLKNCTWEVKKGERVGLVGESTMTPSAQGLLGRARGPGRVARRLGVCACGRRAAARGRRRSGSGLEGAHRAASRPRPLPRAPPGVNGAGKTTQLQIIMGKLSPDAGEVVKAKRNMKIAYLAQEFDVQPGRTVREEFYSVYEKQLQVGAAGQAQGRACASGVEGVLPGALA